MAEENIRILIEAQDNATKAIENLNKSVSELSDKGINNLIKQTQSLEKENLTLSKSFQNSTDFLLSAMNAAQALERIQSSLTNYQIRLENATERLANTQDRLRDAQYKLSKVQQDSTSTLEDLEKAQQDVISAERALIISKNNLKRVQNQEWGMYINIGISVLQLVASFPKLIYQYKKIKAAVEAYNVVQVISKALSNHVVLGLGLASAVVGIYAVKQMQGTDTSYDMAKSQEVLSDSVGNVENSVANVTKEGGVMDNWISKSAAVNKASDAVTTKLQDLRQSFWDMIGWTPPSLRNDKKLSDIDTSKLTSEQISELRKLSETPLPGEEDYKKKVKDQKDALNKAQARLSNAIRKQMETNYDFDKDKEGIEMQADERERISAESAVKVNQDKYDRMLEIQTNTYDNARLKLADNIKEGLALQAKGETTYNEILQKAMNEREEIISDFAYKVSKNLDPVIQRFKLIADYSSGKISGGDFLVESLKPTSTVKQEKKETNPIKELIEQAKGRNYTPVGDFVLRPNGQVLKTSPNDTIIGTKNPGSLGTSIIINIENLSGFSPEEISRALAKELNRKISL